MSFKAFPIFTICYFLLNTLSGQSVASDYTKNLNWGTSSQSNSPYAINFSLSQFNFNGLVLPAISENISTTDRAKIQFYDMVYEPLIGYNQYVSEKLAQLKGSVEPILSYTLEGNQIKTCFYLCPFKEENNQIFQIKSYKFKVLPGMPFAAISEPSFNSKRAASTSVLNSGNWLKFSVTKDGFYKIDAATLQANGVNIASVDPKTLKVYTHQGGMLPEANASFRYDDLPENAIQVIGESDSKLDNGDYILFYAQSPHKWKYNAAKQRYEHETNIYSDKTYVFVTFGGAPGKRMSLRSDGNTLTANASYNWFDYLELHEEELENICHEGRIVLGEKFDQKLAYNFTHNLPNIQNNKMLQVYYSAGSQAPVNSNVIFKMNGATSDVLDLPSLFSTEECFMDNSGMGEILATSSLNLTFSYAQPNSSAKAWLDYYEIHCSRALKYSESFMPFRSIASASNTVAEYRLSDLPNSYMLMDVTDPVNPAIQQVFTDNGEWVFRTGSGGTIRQFALGDGNLSVPAFEGLVANQNLHATGVTQFIIVTHPSLASAANRLADWHRTRDNMSVKVVTPQEIYNEFSSGSQDISALRDYFKHVYYSNTNPVNQLKYVMFMGDASYDYKDKLANNTNFVPLYESEPKWNLPNIFSGYYCSDDYFGYLDSTDGAWKGTQFLEIAVSRLPVGSEEEANKMVDKIIAYKDKASMDEWRNFVSFCADDADAGWETEFVTDFENIYSGIDANHPNVNVRKVYLDAFKQQNLGGSQRYPDAQQAIKKEFEQGTLIFNYIGHGGEEYLSTEKVLDIPLIMSMNNIHSLPVFFTATCEFSRYDDAKRKSAGEYVITQPEGGAVAMFTTTRVVNSFDNYQLTNYFWTNSVFVKSGNKWPSIGDVYKKLKNWPGANSNDRRFTLFADPALTMNYPEYIVKIDSINNMALSAGKDTMKALSKVIFVGHLEDLSGNLLSGFNGIVKPIVYDKPSIFKTLNNDNIPGAELPFELYSNVLYKGQSSVNNGRYTFSFVVPKDINYTYGFGKISMYADDQVIDASGNYKDLIIGGAAINAAPDVTGPEIELFVDDYNFVGGGLTDNSPLLLARVYDENGISTSGIGIGRDIVAIIDKGTVNEKRFVLNSFYTAKLNSYTTGDIKYQLEGISDGKHTYTLKVWDVYNNSNEATIEFVVKNNEELQLEHVLNYPNPFSSNTVFHFDHNHAGENLRVVINVLTVTGKVIKSIDQTINNAPGHVSEIVWNGKDEFEDRLSKGVYIYKVSVTTDDGKKAEKIEKLVILN